ncbi:cupin domain-containing protein [Bdellovibrio sp. HCB209]|uniref:cupin domain-containing protein n=1 Tax=Bdellovibrio sp. HCB209 TaxID=3394354 RepID=UPI0039B37767
MNTVTSPYAIAESLNELWSPVVVSEIESACIKVAKIKGELGWHTHEDEDKIFMVLKGQLKILMDTETITLNQGDMYIVPR